MSINIFTKLLFVFLAVILLLVGVIYFKSPQPDGTFNGSDSGSNKKSNYAPDIDPEDFSIDIDNSYFTIPVGRILIYEGETEEGLERIEITIPGETKTIMGVETLVYRDRVFLDDKLVEDTRDYLAQDKDGNVWYFGEDVDNYKNGRITDHEGSWIAGVDGAQPGIWIKGTQTKGDSYRQEYYEGVAEDMRDVISLKEDVVIVQGSYEECIKVYDWTPLDPEEKEYKYYCKEIGAMVFEEDLENFTTLELVEYICNN